MRQARTWGSARLPDRTVGTGVEGVGGGAQASILPSHRTLQGYWVAVEPNSINSFRNHHQK